MLEIIAYTLVAILVLIGIAPMALLHADAEKATRVIAFLAVIAAATLIFLVTSQGASSRNTALTPTDSLSPVDAASGAATLRSRQ
jgi:hypothetical protein